jgi:O-antigen ligase
VIQWRLVPEILQEKKRWLVGVSPGDAQNELDNKYKQYNFYQGNSQTGDTGFLGYNTHNQFLQCLLQSGIIGLLTLLYLCYALIRVATKAHLPELWLVTILLLAFFFTEAVLQNQKGIVSFTFFPLFMYYSKWSRTTYIPSSE